MAGEQLVRVVLKGQTAEVGDILARKQGRIRDVRQGLDGLIYVAIDNAEGKPTPILRLEPVARR